MSSDLITHEFEDGVLTVTINRPAKANSLTHEMLRELASIFEAATTDEPLRALLITGAGDRVFCGGADLSSLYDDPGDGENPWELMSKSLLAIPVPTIAAINGPCIGGGMTLALGCDMRICVPDARFSYPVLKNNILPDQSDVDRMNDLIGTGRTSMILLGGDSVEAREACEWGLVDRVVERRNLAHVVQSLTEIAKDADQEHLQAMKTLIRGVEQ